MVVTNPFKPDPRVYKEAKSLAKYGHEVYIIAWDREGKYPNFENVDGIKLIRLGPRAAYGWKMALKLPLFYLRAFGKIVALNPDIIHTHDFDTAVLGLIFKLLRGVKWVYDVHDLYFTFFSMESGRSGFEKIVRKIDLLLSSWSDKLIVATQSIGGKHEGLREYYIREGIYPEKIVTIWNVPDVEEFLNSPRLNLTKSINFTIGFIGAQRTVSNFIALFEAIKDEGHLYKVLFVGKGKETETLKKIVREKYPELDVEFIGNIDYRLLPNYYHFSNVIFALYPMRENVKRAIAIKVFEASALGVPSLVNANTLMEDFVNMYRSGVAVDDLKPDSIKKALMLLRSGKIKFSKGRIIKRWVWEREAEKLKRLIEA